MLFTAQDRVYLSPSVPSRLSQILRENGATLSPEFSAASIVLCDDPQWLARRGLARGVRSEWVTYSVAAGKRLALDEFKMTPAGTNDYQHFSPVEDELIMSYLLSLSPSDLQHIETVRFWSLCAENISNLHRTPVTLLRHWQAVIAIDTPLEELTSMVSGGGARKEADAEEELLARIREMAMANGVSRPIVPKDVVVVVEDSEREPLRGVFGFGAPRRVIANPPARVLQQPEQVQQLQKKQDKETLHKEKERQKLGKRARIEVVEEEEESEESEESEDEEASEDQSKENRNVKNRAQQSQRQTQKAAPAVAGHLPHRQSSSSEKAVSKEPAKKKARVRDAEPESETDDEDLEEGADDMDREIARVSREAQAKIRLIVDKLQKQFGVSRLLVFHALIRCSGDVSAAKEFLDLKKYCAQTLYWTRREDTLILKINKERKIAGKELRQMQEIVNKRGINRTVERLVFLDPAFDLKLLNGIRDETGSFYRFTANEQP